MTGLTCFVRKRNLLENLNYSSRGEYVTIMRKKEEPFSELEEYIQILTDRLIL